MKPEPKTLFFENPEDWQAWLADNYTLEEGIFLKFAKKGTGVESLTYTPALEIALCYGWIDGISRRLDDTYYVQKFTPRRAKSLWSKINVARVTQLIKEGRMQPPGQAAIEAAKADGRWQAAYAPPSSIEVPADLLAALAKNKKAEAFFATLNKTNRYAILWRIQTAVKPETRASRITALVGMLEEGRLIH